MAVDDGRKLVVVPCYQEEEYIGRVLDALKPLNQRDDYEVLVVDDGSRDNTAKIAGEMGFKVLTHKRNRGKTQAILTGVKYAHENKFKFIAAIDADTLNLKPEMVEALIEPLKEVHEDGRPKKQMTVGHIQEGEHAVPPSKEHDLTYSGQRAFRVSAFDPYFNGNPKWISHLKGRWPEAAFNELVSREQTQHLGGLTFMQRWPFHGGSGDYDEFIDEQSDARVRSKAIADARKATATKVRRQRGGDNQEHVRDSIQQLADRLRGIDINYPTSKRVVKKPVKNK